MNNYKLIKYENKEIALDVRFDETNNTIWLTQSEIALVFQTSKSNIKNRMREIVNNMAGGDSEYPPSSVDVLVNGQNSKAYNLDMIEAISKRSKSNSGDEFIEWANDILKSNNKLSIAEFSPNENIKSKIYPIRGVQVMLDFELAELYGYSTGAFNQQVQRNIEKFPSDFMFQLSESELISILKSQIVISSWGGRRTLPYAFTEQGIYMLMTVLKGDLATNQSILHN